MMQPIASPIKLRLPLAARNLEGDEFPVSRSLSTKSLSSSNNALSRRLTGKKKKKFKKRSMVITERLKPKSTWQLLPRNVRKFLTTREKQVLPTAASLELERSLLEAFENATIASEEGGLTAPYRLCKNIHISLPQHSNYGTFFRPRITL